MIAGFAEHAALAKQKRLADEKRDRAFKTAEARRRRQEAFDAREKRRMEFVDVIQTQLVERAKLASVLTHLRGLATEATAWLPEMMSWVESRIRQIDELISPRFLDISSRVAKLSFQEPPSEPDKEDGFFSYLPAVELHFWSIDHEKGLATATTPTDWLAGKSPV